MILWIVHRCHRQFYHRRNGLKCCAEFAQNSQKRHAEFANHVRRICIFWHRILMSLVSTIRCTELLQWLRLSDIIDMLLLLVLYCYGLPIVYGRPYCNDAKEGVGGITPPKLNRGG